MAHFVKGETLTGVRLKSKCEMFVFIGVEAVFATCLLAALSMSVCHSSYAADEKSSVSDRAGEAVSE